MHTYIHLRHDLHKQEHHTNSHYTALLAVRLCSSKRSGARCMPSCWEGNIFVSTLRTLSQNPSTARGLLANIHSVYSYTWILIYFTFILLIYFLVISNIWFCMLYDIIGRHTFNCQICTHIHTEIHTHTHTQKQNKTNKKGGKQKKI